MNFKELKKKAHKTVSREVVRTKEGWVPVVGNFKFKALETCSEACDFANNKIYDFVK